jgi:hypothetical protein
MTALGVLIQLWRIGEEMSYFAEAFVKPRGREQWKELQSVVL